MNQNPMIPSNFVTLRQLKEKREQEEKLKKEEEERLRKLKEEEEERLRKLKDEEEASKTLGNHHRQQWKAVNPRRSANLVPHAASNGRPNHEGSKRKTKKNRSRVGRKEKGMTEMPRSLDGSEKTEVIGSDSGPVSDIKKRVPDNKVGGRNPDPNRRGKGRGSPNLARDRGGDGVTGLPLSINKFGAPATVKEVVTKATVEVIRSDSRPIGDIKKGALDLKLGGRNPNQNWGGRRSVVGNLRRGGDGGGGMMWVKKTTKA